MEGTVAQQCQIAQGNFNVGTSPAGQDGLHSFRRRCGVEQLTGLVADIFFGIAGKQIVADVFHRVAVFLQECVKSRSVTAAAAAGKRQGIGRQGVRLLFLHNLHMIFHHP